MFIPGIVDISRVELPLGTGGGGMETSAGDDGLSSLPPLPPAPREGRLFVLVGPATVPVPVFIEPEPEAALGSGILDPELGLDPEPARETNLPVVLIDLNKGVEVVDFDPLYAGRRKVVLVAVDVEEVEPASFPPLDSSPSFLLSQSRSPPCIGFPPALPLLDTISSLYAVEADGGGVGVADLSIFKRSAATVAPSPSLVSIPRVPPTLLSPDIRKIGLIAGLCFLRGFESSSSSLAFADRLLLFVEVVAAMEEEAGREGEEGDVGILFIGIGLPAAAPYPTSEVGLAPSQGLVRGLIS